VKVNEVGSCSVEYVAHVARERNPRRVRRNGVKFSEPSSAGGLGDEVMLMLRESVNDGRHDACDSLMFDPPIGVDVENTH
jgi:hypothetical protein